MISTATSPSQEPLPRPTILVDSQYHESSAVICTREALRSANGQQPSVVALGDTRPDESSYSIIMTLDQPPLRQLTKERFQYFQSILSGSKGILWVTRGALDANPDANMILGLSRVLRSENYGLKLVTLDLDDQNPLSDVQTAEVISRVFEYVFDLARSNDSRDLEFRERKGFIQIPRILIDLEKDKFLTQDISGPVPYSQPFVQEQRPLKLGLRAPGLLDSIYFEDHARVMEAIADDEVEIKVQAAGVRFTFSNEELNTLTDDADEFQGCHDCSGAASIRRSRL